MYTVYYTIPFALRNYIAAWLVHTVHTWTAASISLHCTYVPSCLLCVYSTSWSLSKTRLFTPHQRRQLNFCKTQLISRLCGMRWCSYASVRGLYRVVSGCSRELHPACIHDALGHWLSFWCIEAILPINSSVSCCCAVWGQAPVSLSLYFIGYTYLEYYSFALVDVVQMHACLLVSVIAFCVCLLAAEALLLLCSSLNCAPLSSAHIPWWVAGAWVLACWGLIPPLHTVPCSHHLGFRVIFKVEWFSPEPTCAILKACCSSNCRLWSSLQLNTWGRLKPLGLKCQHVLRVPQGGVDRHHST